MSHLNAYECKLVCASDTARRPIAAAKRGNVEINKSIGIGMRLRLSRAETVGRLNGYSKAFKFSIVRTQRNTILYMGNAVERDKTAPTALSVEITSVHQSLWPKTNKNGF